MFLHILLPLGVSLARVSAAFMEKHVKVKKLTLIHKMKKFKM